jgi:hypothetical protein
METVFLAVLPQYLGYGLSAIDLTEEAAEKTVKNRYHEIKRRCATGEFATMTWKRAKEYFGFVVNEVALGQSYFDEMPGE